MTAITIPKKLTRGEEFVVVPREEYEQLFRFWAGAEPLSQHAKKSIKKGLKEIAEGNFLTSKQAKNALGL